MENLKPFSVIFKAKLEKDEVYPESPILFVDDVFNRKKKRAEDTLLSKLKIHTTQTLDSLLSTI